MFKYNHYVPILKGKAGEFGALAGLPKKIKKQFTPLIDIPPISFSDQKDAKQLIKITDNITESWQVNYPFFVDFLSIQSKKDKPTIYHPFTYMFQHIKTKLIRFSPIPTTGLLREDNYNKAVAEIISKYNCNVCIRLFDDDIINIEDLESELNDLLSLLNVSRKEAHLLLDFRSITKKNMLNAATTTVNIINKLSGITEWQTLTLAASSLPEVVGKKNDVEKIPRIEFSLWKHVISNSKSLSRIPSYGDYGIVHPNHRILDMKSISISPKIRYTLDEDWLILKGQKPKPSLNRASQYCNLSMKLIKMDEFMEGSFSKGDKCVANYASGEIISGDLTKWVEIDTTHHVTLVTNQIANFVVS